MDVCPPSRKTTETMQEWMDSGEGGGDDGLHPRSVVRHPSVDTELASLPTTLAEGRDAIDIPAKTIIT